MAPATPHPQHWNRRLGARLWGMGVVSLVRLFARCVAIGVLWSAVNASTQVLGREPVRSLLEMRHEGVVLQKWDLSCGAAALTTILSYQYGNPVSEREVAIGLMGRQEYLADPGRIQQQHGFSLLDLKLYVDRRGYKGIGYGNLTLENLIDKAPIMVAVSFDGYDHFVVFSWCPRQSRGAGRPGLGQSYDDRGRV